MSVIIPTWNESAAIQECLASTWTLGPMEMIVTDGGSEDDTLQRAEHCKAFMQDRLIVVEGPRGRGRQLAAGAAAASGDVLLFLHADCRLDEQSLKPIRAADGPVWGGFHQHIQDPRWRFRALEVGNALRVRATGRVFGDQALFVDRQWYDRVGGFDKVDLMEDVMISTRLRKLVWPRLLAGPVIVDARRWHRRGVLRQTWLNWQIQIAFARGVTPHELKQRYV